MIAGSETGLLVQRDLASLQSREIEQIVYQLRLRLCVSSQRFTHLDQTRRLFDLRHPQQQLRVTENHVQRIAQLVRQRRQKLILELIGLLRRVARFLFALQQTLALGFGAAASRSRSTCARRLFAAATLLLCSIDAARHRWPKAKPPSVLHASTAQPRTRARRSARKLLR